MPEKTMYYKIRSAIEALEKVFPGKHFDARRMRLCNCVSGGRAELHAGDAFQYETIELTWRKQSGPY